MGCVQLVEMAKERANGKKAEIQRLTYGTNLSTSVSAAQSTALGMPIKESPIPSTSEYALFTASCINRKLLNREPASSTASVVVACESAQLIEGIARAIAFVRAR